MTTTLLSHLARWLVCIERAGDATSLSPVPASVASASEKPEAAEVAAAEPVQDQPSAWCCPNAPLTARAKAGSVLRPRAAVSAIRCCSLSDPPSSPSAQPLTPRLPHRRSMDRGPAARLQRRRLSTSTQPGWPRWRWLGCRSTCSLPSEDGATLDPEAVTLFATWPLRTIDVGRGMVRSPAQRPPPRNVAVLPSSSSASPTPTASSSSSCSRRQAAP